VSKRTVTLVNIGNTNTQYAIAEDGVIGELRCCPTSEVTATTFPGAIPLAVASVVPSVTAKLSGRNPFLVNSKIKSRLNWSQVDVSTLGADRIANAIGLCESFTLPAVCIDCGTAITFEVVDGKGNFLGGGIAPGRMLLRRSLNSYTAQLPLLAMSDTVPSVAGKNTIDAMGLGIDGGAVGMVKELMRIIGAQLGGAASFVVTGGDASFFIRHIEGLIPGGADLTLRGILAAWESNYES